MTVVIATFGDAHWRQLAAQRAAPSAQSQAIVVEVHARTLAQARNRGLETVGTEWVVFLDADDELEPGYVDAMAAGAADVRAPAVRYVRNRRETAPYVPRVPGHRHICGGDCLPDGNWIVVGACARTQLLHDAGGWGDEALYEDWSLWLRCHLKGATFEQLPAAVYRAHVRPDSRNRAPAKADRDRWHRQIHEACMGAAA